MKNLCKSSPSLRRASLLAIILAAFSPQIALSQGTNTDLTSPAAVTAKSKRDYAVSQAEIQFVAALKQSLASAMQGAQLDEANRINKIVENPQANAEEPLTSLRAKTAQTAYRLAVQRATNEYLVGLKGALAATMKAGQLDESNRISAAIKVLEDAALAKANMTPGFVNLLPLIDPEKGTIAGKYVMEKGALVSSGKGQERLEVPYEVPEEYDYQISFTQQSNKNCVIQILSGNGRPFIWVMGADGNFLFRYIKGTGIGSNKTAVKVSVLKDHKRYTAVVKVRKNGAQAFLDGKLISKWDTDFSDSDSGAPWWALRKKNVLGVGSADAQIVFHSIEVKEVTGKGKSLK